MDIKTIDAKKTYTVTKHNGKEVTMTGERLKAYLIAFRNITPVEFQESIPTIKTIKKQLKTEEQ